MLCIVEWTHPVVSGLEYILIGSFPIFQGFVR